MRLHRNNTGRELHVQTTNEQLMNETKLALTFKKSINKPMCSRDLYVMKEQEKVKND